MAGVEIPIVIGIGALVVGVVLSLALTPAFRSYFTRERETLAPHPKETIDA